MSGFYLAERAGRPRSSTLQRQIASISQARRVARRHLDIRHPANRDVFVGTKRELETAQHARTAILPAGIRAMVAVFPEAPAGTGDRALLLCGYAGALRRFELVSLDVQTLGTAADLIGKTIYRSRTDQRGEGRAYDITCGTAAETCPVRALCTTAGKAGAVFCNVTRYGMIDGGLSDTSMALIVKRAAEAAKLDRARFTGPRLRSGFAGGARLVEITKRTRHANEAVARRCVPRGSVFQNAPASLSDGNVAFSVLARGDLATSQIATLHNRSLWHGDDPPFAEPRYRSGQAKGR